jgi:puromycin-sensitive aminopeptidase
MSGKVTRLYNDFKPSKYTLSISINPKELQFKGTVTIKGKKTGRPSQRLTFHQSELKFKSATITKHDKKGDQEIEISRINTQNSSQEVRLHSDQMIYSGDYTVTMEFFGNITKPMNGIYPCYPDKGSEDDIIIATQFESHHAREAFPCIDEPEAKAIFDLTIISPEGREVISNTKIKKQSKHDGEIKTEFFDTPVMSTYLLAFIVGKLEYKSLKTKDGVEVRTYATKNNIDHTQFALETAVKCLDYYNDFFGIPYPLEKSDLIALPDFAAGAMENWGCITFREQGLLVDDENTSIFTKQYVAIVVAHELAHQWFGNLVTMKWWNDLWLNEGFASWIEHLAVNHIFPEWHIWTQFTVDETMPALKLDALDNTHPIEAVIKHPDEIRTIFDLISYNKGASIIHMLNKYLGDDNFRDGLRLYLKRHAYKNTVTDDLWNALEEVSKKPVKEFMNAWTSKPGFPLVTVEVSEDKMELSQKRFFLHSKAEDANNTIWPIPLLDGSDIPSIFDKKEMKFNNANSSFIKLNNGQTGFYRVSYNEDHITKLANLILSGEILPLDRLGILSDTFETVKSGTNSSNTLLQLLMSFSKENNAAVWDIIADILGTIKKVMDDDEIRKNMKPFIRKITKEELFRLSWDEKKDEDYLDQILRPTILGLAASADEEETINEINERFEKAKKSEDIHPNIRSIIYGTVARKGSKKEFDKLLKFYTESESSEDRIVIAMALCSFEHDEQIKQSLAMINSDNVRLQDVGHWIAYSFSNRFARKQTWQWMKDNWSWLEANLGKDMSFNRLPVYAANSETSKEFLKEFKSYFDKVSSPSLDRSIKQGIEILEWHIDWQDRDKESIIEYFKKLKT